MVEALPALDALSTASYMVYGLPVCHVVYITAPPMLLHAIVGAACATAHSQGLWPVLVKEGQDYQCTQSEFRVMHAKHGASLVCIYADSE